MSKMTIAALFVGDLNKSRKSMTFLGIHRLCIQPVDPRYYVQYQCIAFSSPEDSTHSTRGDPSLVSSGSRCGECCGA